MTTVLTEGVYDREFLASEANGSRSRDGGTVTAAGAGDIVAGTLLVAGAATATWDPAGATETADVVAVLLDTVTATGAGDIPCVAVTRAAEVHSNLLVFPATGNTLAGFLPELAAVGIIGRPDVTPSIGSAPA